VNVSAPGLITAYLLVRLAGAALTLVVVGAIACPLVWSRDVGRQARARDTLRLLVYLLVGRGPSDRQLEAGLAGQARPAATSAARRGSTRMAPANWEPKSAGTTWTFMPGWGAWIIHPLPR
jgi:hypothetical protein